jgi:tetratricopeptide (TPR) repeat protein
MVALMPGEPVGWINRSYALHQLKRTREALDTLLPAAAKFPDNLTIAYNLACFACQLGLLAEANRWLKQAMKLADSNQIQLVALEDPDLKPLWEIESK